MYKIFIPLLFLLVLPIQAQAISPAIIDDEKLSFIGMTLTELIEQFGVPKTVAVARGNEDWQDDVVFQYDEGDFFIHKDRVWQVKLTAACGISARDRKAAVMLILGDTAEDNGDHVLLSIPGKNWPVTLRVNFTNSERANTAAVSSIFIYRPDF